MVVFASYTDLIWLLTKNLAERLQIEGARVVLCKSIAYLFAENLNMIDIRSLYCML